MQEKVQIVPYEHFISVGRTYSHPRRAALLDLAVVHPEVLHLPEKEEALLEWEVTVGAEAIR